MPRTSARTPKRPPRQGAAPRPDASRVFRDFLRQLERLDTSARKPAGEGSR
jgi:hypothetical protein